MKTRFLFTLLMFTTLFVGCNKDEDIDIHMLDGQWELLDPTGVLNGYIHYYFHTDESVYGTFTGTMRVYNKKAGGVNVEFDWIYVDEELTIRYVYEKGNLINHTEYYVIEKLTKNECVLVSTGKPNKVLNLRRVEKEKGERVIILNK